MKGAQKRPVSSWERQDSVSLLQKVVAAPASGSETPSDALEFPVALFLWLWLAPDRECHPGEWGSWGFWAPGPPWVTCQRWSPPRCNESSFYQSILWPKLGMQEGLLEVSEGRLRKKGPSPVTSNCVFFRALRLKPLFLEEWGEEELVPFVAKQRKLCQPCSQVTFAAIENQWQGDVAVQGEALLSKFLALYFVLRTKWIESLSKFFLMVF